MKEKIKVLFRHRSMEMGGVEKVILSLLNNLNKEKFEMTLQVSLYQGELRDKVPSDIRYIKNNQGKEDFSRQSLTRTFQLLVRNLKVRLFNLFPSISDKIYLKEKFDIEIATSYTDFEFVLNSSNKFSKKIGWFHSDITFPKLQPAVPVSYTHLTLPTTSRV